EAALASYLSRVADGLDASIQAEGDQT
ncbi:MAG: hypothetical protein ACI8XQ_001908, partial [Bermanella sp.]